MLFIAGASIGWMALLGGVVVALTPVALGQLADYQVARLSCFLDPAADPQGACYQLVQSLNTVGSGGWLGQGLTAGQANQLDSLPVQTTDFIFTVVAEELGLVGGLILLTLFGLLLWRITIIGWRSRDALGRLVAMGMATMLLFQVVVNIGMVIGLLPVTGIPLPLITYGGSSTVSILFGMGIVQSVRMHTRTETVLGGFAAPTAGSGSGRSDRRRRGRPGAGVSAGGDREPGRGVDPGLVGGAALEPAEPVSVEVAPERDHRRGEDRAPQPEQRGAHDEGQDDHRRVEVDRVAHDLGHEQVVLELLDDRVQGDRGQRGGRRDRGADQDGRDGGDDRTDDRDELEDAGHQGEQDGEVGELA